MRWALAFALTVAACEGPPELAGGPATIARVDRFVSDAIDVVAAPDAEMLEAFRIDGAGDEVSLAGELIDGALFVADAPPVYYVRVGGVVVAATAREIDLGQVFLGRPDAAPPAGPVTVDVRVGGLAAWRDGDQLQVYSPGAGLWSPSAFGAPPVGETVLDASVDYAGLPAIEGDRAFVAQLSQRSFGERDYLSLVRGAELPAIDMAATAAPAVDVELADLDGADTLDLDWRIADFDRVRLEEQPILFTTVHDLLLTVLPRAADYGNYGASADLIFARWTNATVDDVAGAMPFGNPYPEDWDVVATLVSWYPVAVQLPGTARTTIWDAYWVRAPLADVDGSPVVPVLGPPRDARADADGLVSWRAPAFGTADWYQLRVYGLYDEAGATAARLETTLFTRATSVQLPPGFVDAAADAYAVQVGAVADYGATAGRPLARALPCAFTTTMTGAIAR